MASNDQQNKDIDILRQTISENNACLQQQTAMNENHQLIVNQLQSSLQTLRNDLKLTTAQLAAKTEALEEQTKALEQEKAENDELTASLDSKSRSIEALEAQIAQLTADLTDRTSEIASLQKATAQLQNELTARAEAAATTAAVEEGGEGGENSTLLQRGVGLERVEIPVLTQSNPIVLHLNLEEDEGELQVLKQVLEEYHSSLSTYRSNVTLQNEKMASLLNQANLKAAEAVSLQGELSQTRIAQQRASQEADELRQSLATAENDLSAALASLQEKDRQFSDTQNVMASLQEQLASLQASASVRESAHSEASAQLLQAQQQLGAKEEETQKLSAESERRRVLYEALEAKFNQLQQVHKQKSRAFEELNAKYSKLQLQMKQLSAESREKQTQMQQKQLEEAKGEIAKREVQIKMMTTKYKEALSVIESLRSTTSQLQGEEMKKLLLTMEQYKKEMSKLRAENGQLAAMAESGESMKGLRNRSFEGDRHVE